MNSIDCSVWKENFPYRGKRVEPLYLFPSNAHKRARNLQCILLMLLNSVPISIPSYFMPIRSVLSKLQPVLFIQVL